MAALDLRDVKDLFADLRREMQDNHRDLVARIEAIEAGAGEVVESEGPPAWIKPFWDQAMLAIQKPGGLDSILNALVDRVRTRMLAPPPPPGTPAANGTTTPPAP